MTGTATGERKDILLVTGMSGAGKSTVLRTLEDLGWEIVDNLPLVLLDRLLSAPLPEGAEGSSQPLAIGIDARDSEATRWNRFRNRPGRRARRACCN